MIVGAVRSLNAKSAKAAKENAKAESRFEILFSSIVDTFSLFVVREASGVPSCCGDVGRLLIPRVLVGPLRTAGPTFCDENPDGQQ
jgi:hypothetical protein